jgi:energy-coupling factor transport system permease protein
MASPVEFFSNIEKDTWIHRLDPRVKLISILVLATLLLFFTDPVYLGGWTIFFLILWVSARVDARPLIGLLYGGAIMVLVYVMYGTFVVYPDDVLALARIKVHLGPFLATDIGFLNGLILGYRLLLLLMPVVLIMATTEPTQMAKALMKLGVPISISFTVLATLRFLPLVFEVSSHVMEAQRVRGLVYTSWLDRIKNLRYLLIPLFINTLRSSRTLGLAVESKGFGARRWNAYYRDFQMTNSDWFALFALILISVSALYIRFGLNLGWTPVFRP